MIILYYHAIISFNEVVALTELYADMDMLEGAV